MSDEEFDGWVANHCVATAANKEAEASLLASRAYFIDDERATAGEMGECTVRLLRNLRVPKFANEHAEAVARELMALRRERDARPPADYSAAPAPPRCPWCRDAGLVAVPHPECVCQPADAPPYLRNYPGTAQVLTGAVLCDSPGCERGMDARAREAKRETRRPRATLTGYLRRFGGLDVVAMLRAYERGVAEGCRARGRAAGVPAVDAALENIKARRAA